MKTRLLTVALSWGMMGMGGLLWGQARMQEMPAGVKAHRDVAYVKDGHERQKLDLYLPERVEEGAPLPLIIWVHGGGWQNGSKEGCPPLRSGYVAKGYAVASINYRLSGHAMFPAQIEDCKAALRWLRAHAAEYGLDAKRFGVWGSSAGGHLVALLGTSGDVKEFDVGGNLEQSSGVQAVCDFYGPTDFEVFVTTPGYERHADGESPEAKLIGGAVLENREKAQRVNPIRYVSADDPAFLIVHGDSDKTVPLNQSTLLFEALKKAERSAHLHTIRNAGHGGPGFMEGEVSGMVEKFFEDRLKGLNGKTEVVVTESTVEKGAATASRPNEEGRGKRQGSGMPWEVVLRRDDKDGDGKVSKAEFSGAERLFERLDRDEDGKMTKEEHEEAMKVLQQRREAVGS